MGGKTVLFREISLVDEDFALQEKRYLGIAGDKIEYIGVTPPDKDYGRVVDGRGLLALPGFVNVHCHAAMALMRGYGEGLALKEWLHNRIFPFEAKMTGEHIYWGAFLGIAEMLSHGITSFSDMYLNGPAVLKAAWDSGIRANVGFGVTEALDGQNAPANRTEQMKKARETAEFARSLGSGRVRADFCLHAEYSSSKSLVRELLTLAAEYPMAVLQVHLSETEGEHMECVKRHGMTPAAYLDSLGFFNRPAIAAHCVHVTEQDRALLLGKKVSVAHCPKSNLKLGSGIAPVADMLKDSINVCVATDGTASNNALDLLDEGKTAALLLKGINRNPALGSPQELLRMMTRNGALAQGRADTGLIKEGMQADLAVFSMEKPHWAPPIDPVAALLFSANSGDVAMTVVAGQVLYENGKFPKLDWERVRFMAGKAREEILGSVG